MPEIKKTQQEEFNEELKLYLYALKPGVKISGLLNNFMVLCRSCGLNSIGDIHPDSGGGLSVRCLNCGERETVEPMPKNMSEAKWETSVLKQLREYRESRRN